MDTLSSTVSTLKVPPILPPQHREFYQFKRIPYAATPNRPPPHTTASITPKITNPNFPFKSSSKSKASSSSPIFHAKPATGYAAAIVDVAQSTGSLHSVHSDVQRLLRLLFRLEDEVVMRHVMVEEGRFHRHVVALLKVVMKKNKVGILQQVLQEFDRIYHQLCVTQFVSSSATH